MEFNYTPSTFQVDDGSFNDGDYYEESWSGFPLGEIPDQVLGTCPMHAMTEVVEYRHLKRYHDEGGERPFTRLSTQFVVDCTQGDAYKNMHSPRKSYLAIYNEGILSVEDYSQPGIRGEHGWIPKDKILGITRYGVDNYELLQDVGGDFNKYKRARQVLKTQGPIYIDFKAAPTYDNYVGTAPHPLGNGIWHAACAIGSGRFTSRDGHRKWYLLYVNTLGDNWGADGFGRVEWEALENVWFPTALCELQQSRRHRPNP